MLTQQQEKIAHRWSEKTSGRTNWWHSDKIKRHINAKLGVSSSSLSAGFNQRLEGPFESAVSVGCGHGHKEMALLISGCVQRFDCYEFSKNRIERAKTTAAKYGVAERMFFHRADAFESKRRYDLVYWNNALHHMMDVRRAVEWSRARLVGGGCFAMDDYIGPTGFQWDDLHLHYANAFRERLSEDLFATGGERPIARILRRRDPKKLWSRDPSEAADSGNIMSAVGEYFQDAEVVYTGGAIYHTALNGILQNIGEDSEILDEALALDDFMIRIGYSNYAIAIARC